MIFAVLTSGAIFVFVTLIWNFVFVTLIWNDEVNDWNNPPPGFCEVDGSPTAARRWRDRSSKP
jgi:hypothetical protein